MHLKPRCSACGRVHTNIKGIRSEQRRKQIRMSHRAIFTSLRQNRGTSCVDFISKYQQFPAKNSNKLAYLAGLIDGEGYLKIEKNGAIRLIIGMTDRKAIYWIKDNFGGNVTMQYTQKGRRFYVWRINQGKDLFYILLLVIPFLVTKRMILVKALQKLITKFRKMDHIISHNYFNICGKWID